MPISLRYNRSPSVPSSMIQERSMIRFVPALLWCPIAFLFLPGSASGQDAFPVHVRVDASQHLGEWREIWRFFGADEPNYAYLPHGSKLIGELGKLRPRQVFFRAHNLLTTGDGTPALKWGSTNAYTETHDGQPVYDWTILDRIFDTYLQNGVRPYAQIGFMPQALSSRPVPYQHKWRVGAPYEEIYTGWAFPPKDYDKWGELVYQWVNHCVQRYGAEEVKTWYWQVWNEANIPYWQGTPEEFHKLHDYAIAAVRRALPGAKVGGPDVAGHGGRFMQDVPRSLPAGNQLRDRKSGHADRLCLLPRQRFPANRRRPRADGYPQPVTHH